MIAFVNNLNSNIKVFLSHLIANGRSKEECYELIC